jgi:hypothetical protein
MERPAAVLAAVYLALLIDGVAQLKGGFLSAFRAFNCRHCLLVFFVFDCCAEVILLLSTAACES